MVDVPRYQARLSDLADAVLKAVTNDTPDLRGEDTIVSGISYDSRTTQKNDLFCCLIGRGVDGHDFAAIAKDRGAAALLVEHPLDVELPQLVVTDSRLAMAYVANAFYQEPSQRLSVVGVTGTNGKTTVTHMLASILAAAGNKVEVLGTLSGPRTTPEAPDLQRQLAAFADAGVEVAAIEVSSHALAELRVEGMLFDVAVFTNLGRDHLDYHESMDAYFAAKARLFEKWMSKRAVVNLDDPYGRLLRDAAQIPTRTYSFGDVANINLAPSSSTFVWHDTSVLVPLGGRFNVSNAIAAATVADLLGVSAAAIVEGLAALGSIPGRFETVSLGAPFTVIVDFAHTPDSLSGVLEAARELAEGNKVHVVFGCGGDRDHSKRAPMGRVASELADRVVLTSDNSRSEDPAAIIGEIMSGVIHGTTVVVEPDRRQAIHQALLAAQSGDVVLIAGKGHETTQEIEGKILPFEDRVVVLEEYLRLERAT